MFLPINKEPAIRNRRVLPRIDLPFKMVVRGVDTTGTRFQESCSVENISAGGLYIRLERTLQPGANLFVSVRLSLSKSAAESPHVAARGHVARVSSEADGRTGIAVVFDQTRWLYPIHTSKMQGLTRS